MNIENQIRSKVEAEFQPLHLELYNESHMHAGPATDSHFKLLLVAEGFNGLNKVKRHQAVYKVLGEELAGPVHALALHLYTPDEWRRTGEELNPSPNCRGVGN